MSGLSLSDPFLYVMVKIIVLALTLLVYWLVFHHPVHPIV